MINKKSISKNMFFWGGTQVVPSLPFLQPLLLSNTWWKSVIVCLFFLSPAMLCPCSYIAAGIKKALFFSFPSQSYTSMLEGKPKDLMDAFLREMLRNPFWLLQMWRYEQHRAWGCWHWPLCRDPEQGLFIRQAAQQIVQKTQSPRHILTIIKRHKGIEDFAWEALTSRMIYWNSFI